MIKKSCVNNDITGVWTEEWESETPGRVVCLNYVRCFQDLSKKKKTYQRDMRARNETKLPVLCQHSIFLREYKHTLR